MAAGRTRADNAYHGCSMTNNQSWTLPRQHQLLTSHLGKFKEHQTAGTLLLKFWPKLTRKFFTMWKLEKRELCEWQILKRMVEGGMAVPMCLGGGTSKDAQEAGLNIKSAQLHRERPDNKEDNGGENNNKEEECEKDNDNKLSNLSSNKEDVRAANEAAMADLPTVPMPEGGGNPAAKLKHKKKKKKIVIKIPKAVGDHKRGCPPEQRYM